MNRSVASRWLIQLAVPLAIAGQVPTDARAADSGTWSMVDALGTPPNARAFHSAVYDRIRQRMIVFGGSNNNFTFNDVYALDLETSTWSLIGTNATRPNARRNAMMIHDVKGDRLIVVGGEYYDASVFGEWAVVKDVWQLTLSGSPTWTELSADGAPTEESFWVYGDAVYDAVQDRAIFHGTNGVNHVTYQLSLTEIPEWSSLGPAGPPGTAYVAGMIHDRPRNRLVTYNGSSVVWKLDLETLVWNTIFPAEPWPSNGFYRGVIYDAARQRLIVAGRWNYDTSSITDVWELPLDSSPVWTQLTPAGSPPPTRYGHSCVYDPVNGRMVLFGGVSFSGSHNDAWFLDWAPVPVGVDDQISKENVSLAARWNRNTSSIDVSFTLPTSGSARLELYDLSGRRVDAQHHELPAGAHSASFARGSPSSGVYMLALRHESGTIAKKVAVLR